MQTFLVGGAVRDKLLGRPVKDRDFVVVGATPEMMLDQGFKVVGADFPVFLHPESQEEYALARMVRPSRSAARVAHTAPDVTLEEDLSRRDLTMNAMALTDAGELVDPFNGAADLAAKTFRHVGPSFEEDPLRILRVARFAARHPDFTVAPETMALMQRMVAAGAVDALVAERVWQELAKGLMESKPSRMLDVLRESGALAKVLPEVDRLYGIPQPVAHHPEGPVDIHVAMVVDWTAQQGLSLPVRWAALMHDLGKGVTPADMWPAHHDHETLGVPLVKAVCQRLRVPNDARDLALMAAEMHTKVHRAHDLSVPGIVRLLRDTKAFRRQARFEQLLDVCRADFFGRTGFSDKSYTQPEFLLQCLAAANSVDEGAIAVTVAQPQFIPERIHAARVRAIKTMQRVAA